MTASAAKPGQSAVTAAPLEEALAGRSASRARVLMRPVARCHPGEERSISSRLMPVASTTSGRPARNSENRAMACAGGVDRVERVAGGQPEPAPLLDRLRSHGWSMTLKRAISRPRRAGTPSSARVPAVLGELGLDRIAGAGDDPRSGLEVASGACCAHRLSSARAQTPGAVQRGADVGDVEVHVGLARRRRRPVRQQPGDDLDRPPRSGSARWHGCGAACAA